MTRRTFHKLSLNSCGTYRITLTPSWWMEYVIFHLLWRQNSMSDFQQLERQWTFALTRVDVITDNCFFKKKKEHKQLYSALIIVYLYLPVPALVLWKRYSSSLSNCLVMFLRRLLVGGPKGNTCAAWQLPNLLRENNLYSHVFLLRNCTLWSPIRETVAFYTPFETCVMTLTVR